MKKTIIYLAIGLGLFLTSCDKFLDRDPQDKISNQNLLKDIEGIRYAMVGTYNSLVDDYYYRRDIQLMSELRGGNVKLAGSLTNGNISRYVDFYGFNLTTSDDQVYYTYSYIYEILNQVNNVIHAVPNSVDGTTEELNQILGEMYALRALCHFDLLRIFAQPYAYTQNGQHPGIAVVTKSPEFFEMPERDDVYDVYTQIIEDLTNAIELTTEENKIGSTRKFWIGPSAAKALLARVYLYQQDWNNAIIMASEVIGDPMYELVDGVDLKSEWLNNNSSSEDIWLLDNSVQQAESVSKYIGYPDISDNMNCSVTSDLYNLYEENDYRLELFAEYHGDTTSYKYHSVGNIESDIVMIRLSEMYLIRAESYARTSQPTLARADLQVIRSRAKPGIEFPNYSGQDLIDEILIEKRRELAMEGHIFYDLARTGSDIERNDCNALTNHDLSYPDFRFIWPIPDREIEANSNMDQNEGY